MLGNELTENFDDKCRNRLALHTLCMENRVEIAACGLGDALDPKFVIDREGIQDQRFNVRPEQRGLPVGAPRELEVRVELAIKLIDMPVMRRPEVDNTRIGKTRTSQISSVDLQLHAAFSLATADLRCARLLAGVG